MIHHRWARVAGGALLGAAASCTVTTEATKDHCANQDGNVFCAEKYPDGSLPFCGYGVPGCELEHLDGCVSVRPADEACYSPCGGGKVLADDPDCEGVAEGSSSSATASGTDSTSEPTGGPTTAGSMSASGTEGSSSTTDGGCTLSLECLDPASPICVDEACVPCSSDEECLEKNPSAPACGDDGRCVVCTPSNASACTDTTPICNAVNECEGCDFHEQCPASACRIATGGCFDPAEVYDVGAGETYSTIEAAVADLGDGGEVVLRIHDGPSYDGPVTIAGAGTVYAFLADDDAMVPQWINSMDAAPTLTVEDGAEVYVQSLRVTGNLNGANPGITADGATLYLDRTEVVGNSGGGILFANAAAGHLRNCIVGGTSGSPPAISVTGGTATLLDSTIVDVGINARALSCAPGGSVQARNSLFYGEDDVDEVSCAAFEATFTASEQALPGEGNESAALDNTSFANFDETDFRLGGPGAALVANIARWVAGDPVVDIEGDLRVGVDGEMEAAGADVP